MFLNLIQVGNYINLVPAPFQIFNSCFSQPIIRFVFVVNKRLWNKYYYKYIFMQTKNNNNNKTMFFYHPSKIKIRAEIKR